MKRLATSFLLAFSAPCAMAQAAEGDVSGFLDGRLGAAGGETSWLDGAFGKLGIGGDEGDLNLDARLARGALVWRPRLTWSTDIYLQLEIDPEQDNIVGVGEAFLRFKPMPVGGVRYVVRAGAFYPPVSLENDGPAWSTTRTLTPSAINSWIGEEVKVAGVEASAVGRFGDGQLSLTGAVFGYNDTSGVLLTFRGWALHDHQIPIGGSFPLPGRDPVWWSYRTQQAHISEPMRELDGRPGYFARAEWRPAAPFSIDVLHYDNAGDKRAYANLQTSWETAFSNVGLRAQMADNTFLLAQAMTGETVWIPLAGGPVPYVDDVGFTAAYVMLDQTFGTQGLAARLEAFETEDKDQPYSLNSTPETGWAFTAAWRRDLGSGLKVFVEGVYVDSDRASRSQTGVASQQSQLMIQSALRWAF